jgi:transcription antitermination factor NusG
MAATWWCAVYTDAQKEDQAREGLVGLAYNVFLPVERYFSRRLKEVRERPLFSRYLFVGLEEGQAFGPIKATEGVRQLLTYADGAGGRKPLVVKTKVIEELQRAESNGVFDNVPDRLKAGDEVAVDGPMSYLIGKIKGSSKRDRMKVLYSVMGRQIEADVPLSSIKRI